MTEAEFANLGLYGGVGFLILLMLFIVIKLARDSKAGKFGTMILLIALVLGVFGFLLKTVVTWFLD